MGVRRGLFYIDLYDISDPYTPERIECFDPEGPRDLYIQDDLLYAADHFDGMKIFDISSPGSPVLLSTAPPGQAFSISVFGDYAYLAYKDDLEIGIRIFDITNPYIPELAGTYNDFGFCTGVYAENDTAYVSAGTGGLWILRYQAPTDIKGDDSNIVPKTLSLQNYPNPFNAATSISFTLPQSGDVALTVYDVLGRKIKTLVDRKLPAGSHSVNCDASGLSSGVYFARLESNNATKTIRMLLLR